MDEFATPRRSPRKTHPGVEPHSLPTSTATPDVFVTPRRSPRKNDSLNTTASSSFASASETTPPAGHVRTKLIYQDTASALSEQTSNTCNLKKKGLVLSGSPKLTSKALSFKSIKESSDMTESQQPSYSSKKLLKGLTNRADLRYTISYVNTGINRKSPKSDSRRGHTHKEPVRMSPRKLALNKSGRTYDYLSSQDDSEADFDGTGQVSMKRKCDFSPTKSRTHVVPLLSNSSKKAKQIVRKYSENKKPSPTSSQKSRSAKQRSGIRSRSPLSKKSRLSRSATRREVEKRRSPEQDFDFTSEDDS